jgi:hypothetical protein
MTDVAPSGQQFDPIPQEIIDLINAYVWAYEEAPSLDWVVELTGELCDAAYDRDQAKRAIEQATGKPFVEPTPVVELEKPKREKPAKSQGPSRQPPSGKRFTVRHLTDADIRDMCWRYSRGGDTLSMLAAVYGISAKSVRNVLAEHDIPIRKVGQLGRWRNGRRICARCEIILEEVGDSPDEELCHMCKEELDA